MININKFSKHSRYITTTLAMILFFTFVMISGLQNTAQALTPSMGEDAPGSFSGLVKNAKDSVVNISTIKVVKGVERMYRGAPMGPNDPFNDFFERFFKDQIPKEYRQRSLGSGFIIDSQGYILTNNHVVEKTDEIKVTLSNGNEYDAEIIGRDPKTDLALIRIKAKEKEEFKPLRFGDSDALEVGDWVVAIGNPFGLDHTVTAGIVSAKYRNIGTGSYDNFIQTDASINPGNSGGPLLNTSGEVVGINSAIFSQSGGNVGIGFAIPSNMAKELLPQLKEGRVVRGWLGVMIQEITKDLQEKLGLKDNRGALVADITPKSPADEAGVKRGDVIITFDGVAVKEMKELPFLVAKTPVNKTVIMEVIRKGEKKSLKVKVGELQEDMTNVEEEDQEISDLGMTVEEITPEMAQQYNLSEDSGIIVVRVEAGSPAGEAGIRGGDIILEIDQEPMKDLRDYRRMIRGYEKGDTILFLIKRAQSTIYLTLKIDE